MKGYRFYLEEDVGTVIAVHIPSDKYEQRWFAETGMYTCVHGVFSRENSPVCVGETHVDYLRDRCKRISEEEAREIHPMLFTHPAVEPDE